MDKNELCRLVQEATKSLTPLSVKTTIISDDTIRISITSKSFDGMPLTRRFKILQDLLDEHTPKLVKRYFPIFDALSKAELDEINNDESEKSAPSGQGRNQAAAQPSH